MYLFKLTDFRTHPIGVMWLRTSTVVCPIVMCDFITVWKWSCRKDNVFISVSHSVHRGDASRGRQLPYGISPPPLPPARIQTVNGRAFNRHFFDLLTQISYFRVKINYKKKFKGMDIFLSITEWIVSNFSE